MQVVWRFSAFAQEQPDPGTWAALIRVTDSWPGIETGVRGIRVGAVGSAARRDELAARMRTVPAAVFTLVPVTTYDAADVATADYVAVFPREVRLHVAHEDDLVPTGPCPGCGLEDPFDVVQHAPFLIAHDAPGDTSALPGGGLAVSVRVLDVLRGLGATGWSTTEIVDQERGRPSERWSQLVADRAVLMPCEHTGVDGDGFCEHCGRALGNVAGHVWLQATGLAGLDVVSRHPGRRAMLQLSRRVVDALAVAGIDDLVLTDPLMVCHRHG